MVLLHEKLLKMEYFLHTSHVLNSGTNNMVWLYIGVSLGCMHYVWMDIWKKLIFESYTSEKEKGLGVPFLSIFFLCICVMFSCFISYPHYQSFCIFAFCFNSEHFLGLCAPIFNEILFLDEKDREYAAMYSFV